MKTALLSPPTTLNKWFFLELGNGCGAVITNKDGIVVDGAPYFLKFLSGKHLPTELKGRYYRLERL